MATQRLRGISDLLNPGGNNAGVLGDIDRLLTTRENGPKFIEQGNQWLCALLGLQLQDPYACARNAAAIVNEQMADARVVDFAKQVLPQLMATKIDKVLYWESSLILAKLDDPDNHSFERVMEVANEYLTHQAAFLKSKLGMDVYDHQLALMESDANEQCSRDTGLTEKDDDGLQ
ncbi:hypothetical protein GGH91_002717 [Coemansia sp. RSA 2671]|nr:hypothetical protein GGH91_002717 [Coemansia sp. RSA 2671]